MNCDGFRKGLRQAAASGGEPMSTAREHVNSCPSCKAAFGGECALFGLIDAGLRAAVNCEIPRGLLQRLRPTAKARTHRSGNSGRATKRDTKRRPWR
jgi:hypothetical protein